MKQLSTVLLSALSLSPLGLIASPGISFKITNPADVARENVTIEIPRDELHAALPEIEPYHYMVIDASTREALINEAADLDRDKRPDVLLFQTDLGAGQTKEILLEPIDRKLGHPRSQWLNARKVPKRIDDFAWENDRMAYRVYGPKAQQLVEQGKKGGIISSGVDVWSKSVPYPIINKWYKNGDYHKDHGEGADFFKVGNTLGAGGSAFLVDGEIVSWPNWTEARVITKGPIRLIFELDYPAVDVNGRMISGTKRMTIERRESLVYSEVIFKEDGKPTEKPVDYVVGLVTRKGTQAHTGDLWGALWGPTGGGGAGELGTAAIVSPEQFKGTSKVDKHLLVHGTAGAGQSARFIHGAVWSERGYYRSFEEWEQRLQALSVGMTDPIVVKTEATVLDPERHRLAPASSSLPRYDDSLAKLHDVIDWQERETYRYSDQGWIRPIHIMGMLEVSNQTGDKELLEKVRLYCEKHEWTRSTNYVTPNELLMGILYFRTNRVLPEEQRGDMTEMISMYEGFLKGDPAFKWSAYAQVKRYGTVQYFVDSLCTGGPGMASLIRETGRDDFRAFFHDQYWKVVETLRDPETGLFIRDLRLGKYPDGRKRLWGRGQGWIFGGLGLILQELPQDDPEYPRYVQLFRELARDLAPHQQPDGFWRANLADYNDWPNVESSSTALITLGYAAGLNLGLLDKESYMSVTAKGWNALCSAVDKEGFLRHVQAEAAAPGPIYPGNNIEYASGSFLLAGAEILKLSK